VSTRHLSGYLIAQLKMQPEKRLFEFFNNRLFTTFYLSPNRKGGGSFTQANSQIFGMLVTTFQAGGP